MWVRYRRAPNRIPDAHRRTGRRDHDITQFVTVPEEQSKPKEFPLRKEIVIVVLNLVLLSGVIALLSACNTTVGVGQDVSATGRAVTNSAEKVKSGL
jgi:predicted small secreted protein